MPFRFPKNFLKRARAYKEPEVVFVDDTEVDDLTDELEEALWDIKNQYDLDTEEIEKSIAGYREHKGEKIVISLKKRE